MRTNLLIGRRVDLEIRKVLVVLGALVAGIATGCEKKQEGAPPVPTAGGAKEVTKEAGPAAATGSDVLDPAKVQNPATIMGTITVSGTVPPGSPVDMGQKPECVAAHGGQPVPRDNLVVGGSGGLQDVFVYVKKGLEKYKFDPPAAPASIDQRGCMYLPHVFGVQVNQDLEIRNSDPFQHNVNVKENNPFNLAMVKAQPPVVKPKHFKKEGVPTAFQCDVHAWMHAYACVVKSPYWAVTTNDGKFTIKGLPAGKYTLAVWHEVLPSLKSPPQAEVEIEVKDGETKTQDFTYSIK